MTGKPRKDSQYLGDALEHLRVLRDHLSRGSLDDALIRDAVHRQYAEITGAGRIDYEYHPTYRASPDGDAHRVVRILSIDLGSH